ncbi:MAG: DUF1722 domain-containing protein [Bdellovibrionales bacterium]|nr:DUF1722 domain-containing protein [Bdellovibrionales bacterium]
MSGCLLGERVRFDGQHKRDPFLVDQLGQHVEWVSFCPELGIGLTVPRASIRLVGSANESRAMMGDTDLTDSLVGYALSQVERIEKLGLSGFVLKKNSPSCGMERVRVYSPQGPPSGRSQGIFARILQEKFPSLPVEEEGRLQDEALRENFVERVFAYNRLLFFFKENWTAGDLVTFHTRHKLQLLSHSPAHYRKLGKLVADAKAKERGEVQREYTRLFMEGLKVLASKGRNTNTLEHMAGYLKKQLQSEEKSELCEVIKQYRLGWVPLIVPLTLLQHYVRKFQIGYLQGQSYLEPNPRELMLRNHV